MESLRMLTMEEVEEIFNISPATLTLWRESGALKPIKTGKRYMYSQSAIRRFQERFEGCKMDNLVNVIESLKEVQEKEAEQLIQTN